MAKRNGFEPVDDKPVAVPVKFRSPPGEVDRLRTLMANLVVDMRGRNDVESFEESLDFETDEDDDPVSHSEQRYMQEEKLLTEAQEAVRVATQRRDAAQRWKEFNRGKGGNRREGTDEGGKRDSGDGGGELSKAGGASGGQAGAAGSGKDGVQGDGGRDRGAS